MGLGLFSGANGNMSLRFDFQKGTLKQDLARLPEEMLDSAFEELMQQAELMKGIAQVTVRVNTGSLRDSIRVERGGEGERWRRVRVRAGGYVTNPLTRKIVNYAVHVEQKYPFMRPAWDQVKGNIDLLIKRAVVERVNP